MNPTFTLKELAARVGGTLRDDGRESTITGIEDVRRAQAHHACWVSDLQFERFLAESRAGVVLIPESMVATPLPMPAIACARLEHSIALLLQLFCPPWPRPDLGIHPTAVVDATAKIGPGAAIGPHVFVGPGVIIGEGVALHHGVSIHSGATVGDHCVFWDHVVVREHCVIGKRVFLHPHVMIGADGFGYYFDQGAHQKYAHGGIVVVEDDVEIGAATAVDRAKFGETRIGRGTKIDNLVQIGHNVRIGPCCIIVAGVMIAGSVELGAGVVVGGGSGVVEHNRLGNRARIGAMSCVWNDVPEGATVSGNPARDHKHQLRVEALVQRLPDMRDKLRALADRIDKLEASADHRQSL